MNFRMRRDDASRDESHDPGSDPDSTGNQAHRDAERLVHSGDEIIDNILSRDSELYLARGQQHGGQ